jgi:hypothetical protein
MPAPESRFVFADDGLDDVPTDHLRVEVPPDIAGPADVFAALDAAHPLPDYAGTNWDALIDVLTDSSWLAPGTTGLALVHRRWPEAMGADDLRTYLTVMRHAMDRLNGRATISLLAIFPSDAEAAYRAATGPATA